MILWILLAILFVYLDQITKYLAVIFLKGEPSFPLIKEVLHFTYVENRGAAFGMLKEHRWVFMVISTVAIIALTAYLWMHRKEHWLQSLSLSMLIGGGIGNMIDRIALGYVIDFVDFTLIDFAVFNIADTFVCVGVALLIFYLVMSMIKMSKEESREKELQGKSETAKTDAEE